MKATFTILLALFVAYECNCQVIHTFDDPDISQWVIEGDGSISHDAAGGNPGGCIFFDDPASGLVTVMTLPPDYSGQWNDNGQQFSYDLLVDSSDPDDIDDFPFLLEISGPGGVALAWPNYVPTTNEWTNISIPISEAQWEVQSGSWDEILENVNQVRLRIEYISGVEDVYVDNIALSFTPAFNEISDTVCSDFEVYGFDGWTFQDNGTLSYNEDGGNPGGNISVGDQFSVLSVAKAPWKFLGDWSVLGEDALLNFDLNISTSSSTFVEELPYLVRIAGPGGEALMSVDYEELPDALNEWHTFSAPINPGLWTVTSGTWESLLANVNQLWFGIEFIQGGETIYLDNICLYTDNPLTTSIAQREKTESAIDVFPNPAHNASQLITNFDNPEQARITVVNCTGSEVLRIFDGTLPAGRQVFQLDLADFSSGVYLIRVQTTSSLSTTKLNVR